MIESIKITKDRVVYKFSDEASVADQDAIRDYGVTSEDDISDALEWSDDVDKLESGDMNRSDYERKWYGRR